VGLFDFSIFPRAGARLKSDSHVNCRRTVSGGGQVGLGLAVGGERTIDQTPHDEVLVFSRDVCSDLDSGRFGVASKPRCHDEEIGTWRTIIVSVFGIFFAGC